MTGRKATVKITKTNAIRQALRGKNPKITTNEVAVILGLSVRTIKSIIKTLVDNNIIKRTNGKKYGHWEIINY